MFAPRRGPQQPKQPIAIPAIVEAMKRDPRVQLANAALAQGASTEPIYGAAGGLARVLQGAIGGIASKRAEQKYRGSQEEYMGDIRQSIADALGNGGVNPGTPAAGGAPTPPPTTYGFDDTKSLATPPDPTDLAKLADTGATGLPSAAGAGGAVGGQIGQALGQALAGGTPQPTPQAPVGNAVPPTASPLPGAPTPPQAPDAPIAGGPPQAPGTPPIATPNQLAPSMPTAPEVPGSPESMRKKLGLALIGRNSPFSFNQGLQDFYAGLEEDARNEATTLERKYQLGRDKYTGELNDYFGARNDARGAEYSRQSDERKFVFDEARARADFDRQWALNKDNQNFQATEADKERSWQQYKYVYEATGSPPDLSNLSADSVFEALIMQESSGRPGVPGQMTKYGRAYGLTQMLDGTAKQMAAKLGLPWQPELMRAKTAEGAEYQRKLGRAYFDEGLQKYGGDFQKALMYYHGGPDEKLWGPKTQAYVGDVLRRLPRTGGTNGLSPVLAGLNRPTGAGQPSQNPFGIKPNPQGKPLPSRVESKLATLGDQFAELGNITGGFKDDYVGYGTGIAGRASNWLTEATGLGDTERVNWWKSYDGMNNVVRNQLFGAALTKQEQMLWERSVITPGTAPKVARQRLDTQMRLLQKSMKRQAASSSQVYNSAQIYELLGGDDAAQQLANYRPLSSAQMGGGGGQADGNNRPGVAPGTRMNRGGTVFEFDGKGWKVVARPQNQGQKKPPARTPILAGFVPGTGASLMKPGQKPPQAGQRPNWLNLSVPPMLAKRQ